MSTSLSPEAQTILDAIKEYKSFTKTLRIDQITVDRANLKVHVQGDWMNANPDWSYATFALPVDDITKFKVGQELRITVEAL